MFSVGHGLSWDAYKHLEELARWCLGWEFGIHGAIHGNGRSHNERKWGANWQAWTFEIGWK